MGIFLGGSIYIRAVYLFSDSRVPSQQLSYVRLNSNLISCNSLEFGCVSSCDVGLASIRKVLQNCLVFKSIYLVDFPITESLETEMGLYTIFKDWFNSSNKKMLIKEKLWKLPVYIMIIKMQTNDDNDIQWNYPKDCTHFNSLILVLMVAPIHCSDLRLRAHTVNLSSESSLELNIRDLIRANSKGFVSEIIAWNPSKR